MQVGQFQSSPTFSPFSATPGFSNIGTASSTAFQGVTQTLGGGGVNVMLGMLMNLMQGLTQLSQGWNSFGGGGQQFSQAQQYPQTDYASMHFPNLATYGTGTTSSSYGGSSATSNQLRPPSDPQEFASYIQAQIAGGALEGRTGVAQSDAIPGSRFGQVQDSTMWQASLARNYAYQFAAQAVGANPLSAEGLTAGQQAFGNMKPEAQLFMQVASVFKGNLLDGPGFYDNPGLKTLLESKGLNNFINDPQVGQTDVQTIGAITAAIDSGQLSLNDVINSGTISDLNRYQNVINYVSSGGFNNDLANYDTVTV